MICATRTHPTAEEIFNTVRRKLPGVSMGTIYRNLQVLKADNLITELRIKGTVSRYEMKQDSHYHFRCEGCRRVFDLDEPVIDDIDKRVSQRTGFKVFHHQTEFRGLCTDCQKENNKEKTT